MDAFSPKERLLRVLNKQEVERPPVICPGGMMNSAIVDVMNKTGHTLPAGHHDATLMAELAHDVHENTGFENFGIPFCMTVEAEVLGSEINYGTLKCEPKIEKEVFPSVSMVEFKDSSAMGKNARVNTIIQATYALAQKYPDVPVIGNLTGPISTAASIVDPMRFLRELRKDPANAHKVVDYVSNHLIELAKLMIDNGATLISIADPTATGEILGPKIFNDFAVRNINKVVEAIHAMNTHVIVHICGNVNAVKAHVAEIKSDAISTDAMVNLKTLKEEYPGLTTMGNLSTFLLELGEEKTVVRHAERLINDGINIIAPACGLGTATPLKNIVSMTQTVKGN
ncbi:uroporphyrinogen decarboxylase family protein [Sporomusa sp. KB1]|uniref:uroporphyrinogen decarboxylase family protein n=1 Tax=Sporomusa sp. KB1 TaxID=943346 RepID=UPI0011A32BCE|nr:uroporphyrinogen decarboxylase family protein [Sporomusa sp. KB1]TWH46813.1 [methyl-Co(III) methanol-specific corrinoid protein]:coenzyme M methyltransferase [Sporomusa sp. KB1]